MATVAIVPLRSLHDGKRRLSGVLSSAERTALVQRLFLRAYQALSQAEDVEKPRVVEPPVPVKTTARSTRNSMLVAAVIGLLLGALAALLWEPVVRRIRTA